MTTADVTVVIPTRNRVKLLRTTLATALAQASVRVRVVIIDDGSDSEAAEHIAALADETVTVLRNDASTGVAAARNRGLAAAATPWVAFLDDDDLWTPGKLRAQLDAVQQQERSWAYTGAVKFAEGPVLWQLMPPPRPEEVARRLATKCVIPAGASNVLVHTAVARRVGGFDAELAHMADWDMWLRLLRSGPPAAADGIHVGYRLHPNSMSLNPKGMLAEVAVLDRRWRDLRNGAVLDPGPTHLWIAMSWLRAGRRRRAALAYIAAARTRPREGLRGLLRTAVPAPPRPAHVTQLPAGRGRLKRVKVVELPPEAAKMLTDWATSTEMAHGWRVTHA